MLTIENTQVMGWEPAIRGMRNPMNSWRQSDTKFETEVPLLGNNDLDLMRRLCAGRASDRKFLRMIVVYADFTAPLYWWKEYDTYKVGTVANSCSTMHKIQSRELTPEMFSTEHMNVETLGILNDIIARMNTCRKAYLNTQNKNAWWQMIQLLPTSYNQRRTVMLNYEVLRAMYADRKAHKQDEWRETFCDWVRKLPYSELITGGNGK